jgi:hypothetical protein
MAAARPSGARSRFANRGCGELSCNGSALEKLGDTIERGVFGGSGMGCLGARGDSGIAAMPWRGDIGGEAMEEAMEEDMEEILTPSLGFRGRGEPNGRSTGRGLTGKPGLIGGGEMKRRVMVGSAFGGDEELRMESRDSGGDR